MKTSKTNVIVYVKQPVHREQTRTITETIGSLHGVINAKSCPRTQSMISVGYDPRIVNSQHILQCVSNQGVDARLVGM
jgi:copper chaperone CopZ